MAVKLYDGPSGTLYIGIGLILLIGFLVFEMYGYGVTSDIVNETTTMHMNATTPSASVAPSRIPTRVLPSYGPSPAPNQAIMLTNVTSVDESDNANCSEWIMLLITSCARWDLLSQTIESFETYNTYKCIENKVVMDDCNDMKGLEAMHVKYKHHGYSFHSTTTPRNATFSNKNKKGKTALRVLYAIKEGLTTYRHHSHSNRYVLLLEDDWKFYENGFVEDSLAVLSHHEKIGNPQRKISFLRLRNLQIHYPRIGGRSFCGGSFPLYRNETTLYNISGSDLKYYLGLSGDCYLAYSNHPGLKLIDVLLDHIMVCMGKAKKTYIRSMEHCLGCQYRNRRFTTAKLLYPANRIHGYVGHNGAAKHANNPFMRRLININDEYLMNATNCKYIAINKNKSQI
eukprot:382031_1